jgi:hypothetical protein
MTSAMGSNDGMMMHAPIHSPMNSTTSRFNSNGKISF